MEAQTPYVTWPQLTAELNQVRADEAVSRQSMQNTVSELGETVREYVQVAKTEAEVRQQKAQRREKIFNRVWALCVVVVTAVLAVATPSAVHAIFGVVGV
jgi:t-SNARE complex subunit (syntaxin)